MSLSLALGILVSDLSGFRYLTTSAHAQEDSCGSQSTGLTVIGSTVTINTGIANGGVSVRDVFVNGELVAQGVVAGTVRIVNSEVSDASGVIVGSGSPNPSGVIVGSGDDGEGGGTPCIDGVIVGSGDNPDPSGVIVGSGNSPSPTGVIVGSGSGEVAVDEATFQTSGTFVGGTLTGDNIHVVDGVITGENLLLSGATIDGGSIGGFTVGRISPVN